MPRYFNIVKIAVLCHLLFAPVTSSGAPVERQREMFLQAEQAIKEGRTSLADELMAGLADYPLLPYLSYQKTLRGLDDTVSVVNFLDRFKQTRQAIALRQRWLERLAARGEWSQYVTHYRETENPNLQCNYYLALANLGRKSESWAGAEKLWPSGSSLPESCEKLFALWQASPQFTVGDAWKRFALAMQQGNLALAGDLQRLLPPSMLAQAELWQQVHANPRLVLSCSTLNPHEPASGSIFAHGIDRLTTSEPMLALTAWLLHKNRYAIDGQEAARIDRRTALALAGQRLGQAGAYLLELPNENADEQIRGWRVRAALAQEDWPGVLAAIEMLRPQEKTQAQWLYWKARALSQFGATQAANEAYQAAAKERDFYGFNAADRIGVGYALTSTPATIGEAELQSLAANPAFSAIAELLALRREKEARSEWFHAIQSLPPGSLVAAAKLAQRWGLDNLAINTAAKASYWDDLALRFPLGQNALVLKTAQPLGADPAMIYALVRRESAFDPNAGSPVGAVGLMQLMPATGALVASRLNEILPSANALVEPERNLRYGISYFKELLERFGNQFALAATAYNAGPNRAERWLPADHAQSADVWIETLPVSETRQYVAAVLAYAIIYQNRLGLAGRHISEWLPEVSPGTKSTVRPDRSVSVQACEN